MTKNERIAAFFGCIGALLLIPVVIAYGTVLGAFVLFTLWGWFVVPIFAVPALTLWQAAGLGLVLSYARGLHEEPNDKNKSGIERVILGLFKLTAWAGWLLLIGYVIHAIGF